MRLFPMLIVQRYLFVLGFFCFKTKFTLKQNRLKFYLKNNH